MKVSISFGIWILWSVKKALKQTCVSLQLSFSVMAAHVPEEENLLK